MAAASTRTLQLLALLQSRRAWTGGELADRLEVTPRTLRRDVERLRSLGYLVRSTPGVGGGYQLVAGSTMLPLLLDDAEAVAVAVALNAVTQAGVSDITDTSLRALSKVIPAMPVELRRRAEALALSTVPASWSAGEEEVSLATLAMLAEACRDRVRLDFTYTDRAGATSERRVEPYHLVSLGRRWYLLAYDPDREDWRTFRADRIEGPRPLRNSFDPRPLPADDIGAYVRDRVGSAGTTIPVEILVEADPHEVEQRFGRVATVEPMGEGRHRVRMKVDGFHWVGIVLGMLRAPFTVIEPPELAGYLRDLTRFLAANVADVTLEPE
jgi:predicted DNA-binding transcriptional regulator YafY